MKHLSIAAGVIAAMCAISTAKAEEPAFPGWGGLYFGATGGQSATSTSWKTNGHVVPAWGATYPYSIDSSATSFDARPDRMSFFVGYNYMITPVILAGIEAELGRGSSKTAHAMPGLQPFKAPYQNFHTRSRVISGNDSSLRLRAGYVVMPRLLVYATGGYATQMFRESSTCVIDPRVCNPDFSPLSHTSSKRLHGWTAGIGTEYQLLPNLIARVEYRRTDLDSTSFTAMPYVNFRTHGIKNTLSSTSDTMSVGLALKF